MNTMEPSNAELVTQMLIHAGFALTAFAFLVRDILWLRLLAILANACVGLAAYQAGAEPRWDIVAWAATFVAINAVHSAWLVYERHIIRLTEEEKPLTETAFQALDPV